MDPVGLQVTESPVRIQTLLRGFLKIEGSDVAASSALGAPEYVKNPFVFIVEETKSDAIIFIGRITKGEHYTRYANAYTKCKPFSI